MLSMEESDADPALQFIRALIDHLGTTPSELAAKAGLASTTLTRPLNDPVHKYRVSRKTIDRLIDYTGVLPKDLGITMPEVALRTPPRAAVDSMTDSEDRSDFLSVPRFDVQLSGGSGSFIDRAKKLDMIPFTADFILRRLGRTNAQGLAIFEIDGTSMEPLLGTGDLIMIDRTRKLADGSIMAFREGDGAFIKYVSQTANGYRIWSHNQSGGDARDVRIGYDSDFEVIGKAVWMGRTF